MNNSLVLIDVSKNLKAFFSVKLCFDDDLFQKLNKSFFLALYLFLFSEYLCSTYANQNIGALIRRIPTVFGQLEWETDPVITTRATVPTSWSMIPRTMAMSTSFSTSLALATQDLTGIGSFLRIFKFIFHKRVKKFMHVCAAVYMYIWQMGVNDMKLQNLMMCQYTFQHIILHTMTKRTLLRTTELRQE